MATWLSIIIPALNEARSLPHTLRAIEAAAIPGIEVLVADGGSTDATREICAGFAVRLIESRRGRACQMNTAASQAQGRVLWFLHADTLLNADCIEELRCFERSPRFWGRFNIELSGTHPMFRVIELMINQRSFLTGVATGDQGFFMKRDIFQIVGGFPEQPLMEDLEMSYRLNRLESPVCSRKKLITSSRRWEQNGIGRTILQMWWLRWRYYWGASANQLAKEYYPGFASETPSK